MVRVVEVVQDVQIVQVVKVVPERQWVGLEGPRGSRGRPTVSQGVKG